MKRNFLELFSSNLAVKSTELRSTNNSILVFIPGYFSATSIGPNRLFVEIEEALIDKISVSYRIDWPGMGDASGNLYNYGFDALTEELANFLLAIKSKRSESKISVLCHSMGCALLLAVTSRLCYNFKNIVLFSPITSNKRAYSRLVGDYELLNNSAIRKGIRVNCDFLKNDRQRLAYEACSINAGGVTIFYCIDDPYVSEADIELLASKADKSSVHAISKGGHNYVAYEPKCRISKFLGDKKW